MKRILVLAAFILAAMLPPAYSANVTVIAEGVFEGAFANYSDPDGLLPFSEPAPGTIFTMEFTFDDATPDQAPEPDLGAYVDAISAAGMMIGSSAFGKGEINNIVIGNDLEGTGGTFTTYTDLYSATSHTRTPDVDPDFVLFEGFAINLVSSLTVPPTTLTSIDLTAPPWPSDWGIATTEYFIIRRPEDGSGSQERLASAITSITSISVVPLPAAIWLLGSALGLLGWMKRRIA